MNSKHLRLWAFLAILAVLACSGKALAIDFEAYDHNGDGQVTDAEYHATPGSHPWDGDLNDDGFYSMEEITALDELAALKQSDREKGGSAGHLSGLDVNDDGKLSFEEFQAGFPNVTTNPDTNLDGHIELSELEAVKEAGPGQEQNASNDVPPPSEAPEPGRLSGFAPPQGRGPGSPGGIPGRGRGFAPGWGMNGQNMAANDTVTENNGKTATDQESEASGGPVGMGSPAGFDGFGAMGGPGDRGGRGGFGGPGGRGGPGAGMGGGMDGRQ